GVRIAVSVDHQVLQRRNVDDAELPAAGAVAVELLEIGLGHARTLAGTTDTDDANEGADPPATALLGAVGRPTMPLWLCGLCSLCGALRLLRHRRPSRDRIARAPGLASRVTPSMRRPPSPSPAAAAPTRWEVRRRARSTPARHAGRRPAGAPRPDRRRSVPHAPSGTSAPAAGPTSSRGSHVPAGPGR